MFCVSSLRLLPGRIVMSSCVLSLLAASLVPALTVSAQKPDDPLFASFKGVTIGMNTDDARKKLGSPKDKSDEQDFYVFNDNQAVQVYYDKATRKVTAISIDFMTGANEIPTARQVIGSEVDPKADGSGYKLVRYPKAGYWVSYSRTAGKAPTITITMQKIE
jgi:hypothetical protein